MTKQTIIINGRKLTWDVPVKVMKKKKRKKWKKRKEEPNLYRTVAQTNFVRFVG